MTNLEFAMLMKRYRALKNFKLVELSTATNLSLTTLVKIEKTGKCLLRTKIAIAQALEFSKEDLNKLFE